MNLYIKKILLFIPILFVVNNRIDAFVYSMKAGSPITLVASSIQLVTQNIVFRNNRMTNSYIFKNNDSVNSHEVEIAFPVIGNIAFLNQYNYSISESSRNLSPEQIQKKIIETYNFFSLVNNEHIELTLKPVSKKMNLKDCDYIFTISYLFRPGEEIRINNTFNIEPNFFLDFMSGHKVIDYILTTGSGWNNNIEVTNIIFYIDLSDFYFSDKIENIENFPVIYNDTFGSEGLQGNYMTLMTSYNYKPDEIKLLDSDELLVKWEFNNFDSDNDIQCKWDWEFYSGSSSFWFSLNNLQGIVSNYIINDDVVDFYTVHEERFFTLINNKKDFIDFLEVLYVFLVSDKDRGFDIKKNSNNKSLHILSRFYINSIYALNNYKFSNSKWEELFKKIDWYNDKTISPDFTDLEEQKIKVITAFAEKIKLDY